MIIDERSTICKTFTVPAQPGDSLGRLADAEGLCRESSLHEAGSAPEELQFAIQLVIDLIRRSIVLLCLPI